MKTAVLCLFMGTGLLFAHHQKADTMTSKISGNERLALATSSPPVRLKAHRHMNKKGDVVVTDKTTVNAFVPVGK